MKLTIFGPPGSGKGTYASRLQSILGIVHISTGDMLRETAKQDTEIGRRISESIQKGNLSLEDTVTEMLRQRLKQPDVKNGFLLDGYPRTIKQAKDLDNFVTLDALINLIVPEDIIIMRLSSREICRKCGAIYNRLNLKPRVNGVCDKCGGELFQREDDKPDVIRERLRIYEEQIKPVLDYYRGKLPIIETTCTVIDMPPERMVNRIIKGLKKLKPAKVE